MYLKLFTLLLLALVLPVFTYTAAFMAFGWTGIALATIAVIIQYYTGKTVNEIREQYQAFHYGD